MRDGQVPALFTFAVIVTSLLLLQRPPPASSFQPSPHQCLPPSHRPVRASTALSVVQDHRQTSSNSVATGKYDDRGDVKKARYTELERLKFQLQQVRGDLHLSEMRATAAERRVASFQAEMKHLQKQQVQERSEVGNSDAGGATIASAGGGDNNRDGSTEAERNLEKRLKRRFDKQKEKLTERVRHFGDALQKVKMEAQSALDDAKAAAAAEEGRLQNRITELQSKLDATSVELGAARDEPARLTGDMDAMLANARSEADEEVEKVRAEMAAVVAETERIAAEEMGAALEVAESKLADVRREMAGEVARTKEEAARDVEVVSARMRRELIDVKAKARLEHDRLKGEREQLKRELIDVKAHAMFEQERLKGEAEKVIGEQDVIIQKYERERSSVRKLVKMALRLAGKRTVNVFRRRKKA